VNFFRHQASVDLVRNVALANDAKVDATARMDILVMALTGITGDVESHHLGARHDFIAAHLPGDTGLLIEIHHCPYHVQSGGFSSIPVVAEEPVANSGRRGTW
jgi:hypothetical protein